MIITVNRTTNVPTAHMTSDDMIITVNRTTNVPTAHMTSDELVEHCPDLIDSMVFDHDLDAEQRRNVRRLTWIAKNKIANPDDSRHDRELREAFGYLLLESI